MKVVLITQIRLPAVLWPGSLTIRHAMLSLTAHLVLPLWSATAIMLVVGQSAEGTSVQQEVVNRSRRENTWKQQAVGQTGAVHYHILLWCPATAELLAAARQLGRQQQHEHHQQQPALFMCSQTAGCAWHVLLGV